MAGKARHSAPATFPEIIGDRAGNSKGVPPGYAWGQNQTPPHVPAHCNAHLVSDTMDILESDSLEEEAFSLEIVV